MSEKELTEFYQIKLIVFSYGSGGNGLVRYSLLAAQAAIRNGLKAWQLRGSLINLQYAFEEPLGERRAGQRRPDLTR